MFYTTVEFGSTGIQKPDMLIRCICSIQLHIHRWSYYFNVMLIYRLCSSLGHIRIMLKIAMVRREPYACHRDIKFMQIDNEVVASSSLVRCKSPLKLRHNYYVTLAIDCHIHHTARDNGKAGQHFQSNAGQLYMPTHVQYGWHIYTRTYVLRRSHIHPLTCTHTHTHTHTHRGKV